jgi:hypothetical protein
MKFLNGPTKTCSGQAADVVVNPGEINHARNDKQASYASIHGRCEVKCFRTKDAILD